MTDREATTGASARLPTFSPEERDRLRAFWEVYDPHRAAVEKVVEDRAARIPVLAELMDRVSLDERARESQRSRALQAAAILEERWAPYVEELRLQGSHYAQAGVEFSDWFQVSQAFLLAVIDLLCDVLADEPVRRRAALKGASEFLNVSMDAIAQAYNATKEQVITEQQEAIRELSLPVLQVRPRLLVLPIIGGIDTHRARHLTGSLLHAIRERRARVVVIDITGVPVVDSKVASHLVQAVEAGRLMGARVIVTGISPEIAITMVALGADLPGVPTEADLQAGLEQAGRYLEQTDRLEGNPRLLAGAP